VTKLFNEHKVQRITSCITIYN